MTDERRLPDGIPIAEIPLESCKAYPIKPWIDQKTPPRIAYADLNTHNEQNQLSIKLLPGGGKTAPHPQIVLYIKGPYHVETLGYTRSDPLTWTTWMELHLDSKFLGQFLNALVKAKQQIKKQQGGF